MIEKNDLVIRTHDSPFAFLPHAFIILASP